jgi:hypothetical protein
LAMAQIAEQRKAFDEADEPAGIGQLV